MGQRKWGLSLSNPGPASPNFFLLATQLHRNTPKNFLVNLLGFANPRLKTADLYHLPAFGSLSYKFAVLPNTEVDAYSLYVYIA